MKVYTHKDYSYVRVAEIPKSKIKKIDFAVCNQPTETLLSFYNRQSTKPAIVVNAGFFCMSSGATVFNLVSEGTTYSHNNSYQWGMGVLDNKELLYGCLTQRNWRDFISGYPVFLDNGKKCKITFAQEINYRARRTILGYNDTTIFVICIESPGMNFSQIQNFLLELGLKYAINLDGGGSTKMLHYGKSVTKDATNRPVDNVLAIYLDEEANKIPTVNEKINVIYQSHYKNSWLPAVMNYNNVNGNGYAGIEKQSINGVKIQLSKGDVEYRLHKLDGSWTGWFKNNSPILIDNADGIQMRLCGDLQNKYDIIYRVSLNSGSSYLAWVYNDSDYAGIYGKNFDKLQIYVQAK